MNELINEIIGDSSGTMEVFNGVPDIIVIEDKTILASVGTILITWNLEN